MPDLSETLLQRLKAGSIRAGLDQTISDPTVIRASLGGAVLRRSRSWLSSSSRKAEAGGKLQRREPQEGSDGRES